MNKSGIENKSNILNLNFKTTKKLEELFYKFSPE